MCDDLLDERTLSRSWEKIKDDRFLISVIKLSEYWLPKKDCHWRSSFILILSLRICHLIPAFKKSDKNTLPITYNRFQAGCYRTIDFFSYHHICLLSVSRLFLVFEILFNQWWTWRPASSGDRCVGSEKVEVGNIVNGLFFLLSNAPYLHPGEFSNKKGFRKFS